MYRHWQRFGFWFGGWGYFPHHGEYVRMIEEYKRGLEAKLEAANKELEELRKGD